VRAAGGDALPSAQDATRANNPEEAARYAVTPAACYEAVTLAKKRAQAEREAGETPFEILGRAADKGAPFERDTSPSSRTPMLLRPPSPRCASPQPSLALMLRTFLGGG
jgi:hypothetical protein